LARAAVKWLISDGWVRNPETTSVLEPSCGEMAWVTALLGNGFARDKLLANDVNLSGKWTTHPDFEDLDLRARDFLRADYRNFDLIVGNPPYNDTMAHLEVSFAALTSTGVLAYLLPIGWFTAQGDDGSRQAWIQGEGKPAHVYLVTPRPKFREGPGTDSAAYAMVVWAPGARRSSGFDILDWYSEREIDNIAKAEAKKAAKAAGIAA